MTDPHDEMERTGSGGSSDGDTQPDDAGATGTLGEHAIGEKQARKNRENESPA